MRAERACLSVRLVLYVFVFVERPCAVSGMSESPTSKSSRIVREPPGFGDDSDSPGEARLRIVAEQSWRSPASDSGRTVRERPGFGWLSNSPGVARLRGSFG